jgi:release factor glutamine methyltransferase
VSETRLALQTRLAERLGSRAEARWIVEEVLGQCASGAGGTLAGASDDACARAETMAERRLAGEPLQYVLGSWAFRTIELVVDARALIPRPETEQVVEVGMAELRRIAGSVGGGAARGDGPVVVDLGTGTGAIALSMAAELVGELPGLELWATDADPAALSLAAENRERVASSMPAVPTMPSVRDRVHLLGGSWYAALPPELRGRVAMVISNPPYVSAAEWEELDPQVRQEPLGALVAGSSSDGTAGLADVEAVLRGAPEWLVPGGVVVVELAPHQAAAAANLAERADFTEVRVVADLAGRDRTVVARR